MTHLAPSLVSLLLFPPAPSHPPVPSLPPTVTAIPESAAIAILIPDVHDLVDSAAESTWARYLFEDVLEQDPATLVFEVLEIPGEGRADALEDALGEIESLAIYVTDDPEAPTAVAGVLVGHSEESGALLALLEESLGVVESPVEAFEHLGTTVEVFESPDNGYVCQYRLDEMLVFQQSQDLDALVEGAEELLDAVDDEDHSGLAERESFREVGGGSGQAGIYFSLPALLAAIDLDVPATPEGMRVFEGMTAAYASLELGAGEHAVAEVRVVHGEDHLLARFFELFGPGSGDLLSSVPRDAVGVLSTSIDIEDTVEWAFDLVALGGVEAEQVRAAVDLSAASLGFHPIEDYAELLTGDIVGFSRPLSSYLDGREQVAEGELTGSLLFGVDDGEAFLEGTETLFAQMQIEAMFDVEEEGGLDVFRPVGDEFAGLAISDDFVAVCVSDGDLQRLIETYNGDSPSVLDSPRLGPMFSELEDTTGYSLFRTADLVEVWLRRAATTFLETLDEDAEDTSEHLAELAAGELSETFGGCSVFTFEFRDGVAIYRSEASDR